MIILGLLLLPFFAALTAIYLAKKIKSNWLGWLLATVPLLMLALLLSQTSFIAQGGVISLHYRWFDALGISFSFRIDGLSQLLLLLICGIGFPIVIYSKPYFNQHSYLSRYYCLLFLFMTSMIGAVCADDLITLYVFWELTSICSFLLIGLNHQRRTARKAAIEALFITTLGGLALLASFILLAEAAATQSISMLVRNPIAILEHPYFPWMLSLFLIGAFTKSAQFPFSFWLPGAMAAPTPVSAYLHSATMVQLGIYLLARFHPLFADSTLWFISLTTIGSITMLSSVVTAFKHLDMKLILAYTTITALGSLVFILAGTDPVVIKASVSFLLVHALYKANLFMAIGDIQHQTGTRHLKYVGGLHRVMPITFLAVLVAGCSMAGLPPLLGFYVKELVYEASLAAPSATYILTFIVVFANMMMAAIAFTLVLKPFWGKQYPSQVREANYNMSVNALLLAIVTLFFSVFTQNLNVYILSPAAEAILGHKETISMVSRGDAMWPSLILSAFTLGGAVLIYIVRRQFRVIILKTNKLRWFFPYHILQLLLIGSANIAKHWTTVLQTKDYSRYVTLTFLTLCLIIGFGFPQFSQTYALGHPNYFLFLLLLWLLSSAISLLWVQRFITGLIGLSAFGLGLALLFVIQGAPDLAMTQLLIETLMVILIVFSLSGLKQWPTIQQETYWHRFSRAGIAICFGVFISLNLNALFISPFNDEVGRYFLNHSLPLGHGLNVVNVILVDFRALDTLGESVVLLIAAFGIRTLLNLNRRSGSK
ncbi:hydrogen gas-evolving membrane-bound hydrogenase subunit E [Legionella yabuuchiae]|uniref:hydrogen gas-evolving membrane-bound hydrogenase subunit E n=1 Tax=Legionella yabuuchiae TaxID=376727 RepID=UPI001056808B|nr:hydrogen gas-evolving membrane-bound hydrogenase subunit E [Legionella yabuuchiae]